MRYFCPHLPVKLNLQENFDVQVQTHKPLVVSSNLTLATNVSHSNENESARELLHFIGQ